MNNAILFFQKKPLLGMNSGNMHTIMLAPMAELSHRALRELIEEFQAPHTVYFTEMISATALLDGGPLEKWYINGDPCQERLVYQLLGANEEALIRAATLLDRQNCLGIDINMGCCAPQITRTGAGIRWMEDPDKSARLIENIRRVTNKQLSVKIRLGPKTGKERLLNQEPSAKMREFPYLLRFCRRLEETGLDMVILHPRLATEKFKRSARWEYIRELRKELTIPVIGNGDINSAEELAKKAAEGLVMAGRLLVREPWAIAEALHIPSADCPSDMHKTKRIKEIGSRFLTLLAEHQPPEFHLSRARRFFHYYCDNLVWAEYMRNKINQEKSLQGIENVWQNYFK